jgi:hypothetical protein
MLPTYRTTLLYIAGSRHPRTIMDETGNNQSLYPCISHLQKLKTEHQINYNPLITHFCPMYYEQAANAHPLSTTLPACRNLRKIKKEKEQHSNIFSFFPSLLFSHIFSIDKDRP